MTSATKSIASIDQAEEMIRKILDMVFENIFRWEPRNGKEW